MSDSHKGILLVIAACTIWGLSPLYYKLLVHVPPFELLAHRTFWSFFVFAALLTLQGHIGKVRQALATPRAVGLTLFAALMVTSNWLLFIVSVQIERVTELSLGYYISPIVSVVLGVTLLRERLSAVQWVAVVLASLAVVQMSWGLGTAPWIAVTVAVTFAIYGYVKKRMSVGPMVSVTAEVTLLMPIALGWLLYAQWQGQAAFGRDLSQSVMLIFSGVLTAAPLMMFSAAAQRVKLATLGLMQYINPTLQFLCATVIFAEPFGWFHAVTFGLIWTALALYSGAGVVRERALRKSAMTSSAEPP